MLIECYISLFQNIFLFTELLSEYNRRESEYVFTSLGEVIKGGHNYYEGLDFKNENKLESTFTFVVETGETRMSKCFP